MSIRGLVFVATSLDGFIARQDGGIDWLNEANASVPPGEDCGHAEFTSGIDAMVIGRRTYETVLGFGGWVYGQTPVIVWSRTLTAPAPGLPPSVTFSAEPPQALARRLAERGLARIYVDGGQTIQAFLAAGLIEEIIITVIPILLGTGIPLFGPLPRDVRLKLVSSQAFPFGFVQNRYRIADSR